jgi:hypothetical protein
LAADSRTLFVSVIRQLDFRDRFEAFVSASQNHVSRLRRPALAETDLNAASMGGKAEHLALPCHSAGKSVRWATPMPCGSRPSMAALTISGARKASEIVMLTFRTLQPSRFAMLSLDIDASVLSSSSQ